MEPNWSKYDVLSGHLVKSARQFLKNAAGVNIFCWAHHMGGGHYLGVPPQPSEIWGGTTYCPPKVLDYGGALTLKISAPPSRSVWGGTTFGRYLAHNLLRNGRFEAEKSATVWRAYGARAPSLLAP